MTDYNLSDEQSQVLEPGSMAVEACPGAGKTTAVVARYRLRALQGGGGIALVSFTNRAVEEAITRCSSEPHLLQPPNYIGTFDTFLHRFLLTPFMTRALGASPRYLRSWDELPIVDTTVRTLSGVGIRLSSFAWTKEGPAIPDPDKLSRIERPYYDMVIQRKDGLLNLRRAAYEKLNYLVSQVGVVDPQSARYFAYIILTRQNNATFARRLALRFKEIIVDEFQDCDSSELGILNHLYALGLNIVTVSDPDQAIFDFRLTQLKEYTDHIDFISKLKKVTLSTNYRSTPIICALATSLRASNSSVIVPCAIPPPGPDSIHLLVGDFAGQREMFTTLLESKGISLIDSMVLAHRRSDASKLAGVPPIPAIGRAKGDRIAMATATLLQNGQSVQSRVEAMPELENLILSAFAWEPNLIYSSKWRKLENLGMNADWLRILAARLVNAIKSSTNPNSFGQSIRDFLNTNLSGLPIDIVQLSSNFRKPDKEAWESISGATNATRGMLPFNTIHSAKGSERTAILLAIPPRIASRAYVLDDWEAGSNTEQRRVLYVGATRARNLLAIAVHESSLAQLELILVRDAIPYTVSKQ